MKRIALLLIALVFLASVSAVVTVTVSDSTQTVVLYPGNEQPVMTIEVANNGLSSVVLESIVVGWNNINYMPIPAVNCFLTGSQYGSAWLPAIDLDFYEINNTIGSGETMVYFVIAMVQPDSEIGSQFRLSVEPGSVQFSQPETVVNIVGRYGKTCIVTETVDPSQPLGQFWGYPQRTPSVEVYSNGSTYRTDSWYVFPGQRFDYQNSFSVRQDNYYPDNPNCIVGVDMYSNADVSQAFNYNHWTTLGFFTDNGLTYNDDNNLVWVANGTAGLSGFGVKDFQFTNNSDVIGEIGSIFSSIQAQYYIPAMGVVSQSYWDNIHIINNPGRKADIDGGGTIDSLDTQMLIRQWMDQEELWPTRYNPDGQPNISRQQGLIFSHESTANAWVLHGFLENPSDTFFGGFGIGNYYTVNSGPAPTTYSYTNEAGLVTVTTEGNAASIIWKNTDGRFAGQDLVNQGSQALFFRSDSNTIIPEIVPAVRNGMFQFQLPNGAELVSVDVSALPMFTGIDDPTTPVVNTKLSCYPNPFSAATTIKSTGTIIPTKVEIFNIKGQKIQSLANDSKTQSIIWDG
ncbi:T9SS type A sorting domain-containing protein, partial [Candidatus Saccharibacteria bacterium]|nr:T9SS type A sorting domain-containing protein [Candidatus Saccharibacteria bacterium]